MSGYFLRCRRCRAVLLGAMMVQVAASVARAADALPTGGHFTAGNGSIAADGSALSVTQSSKTGIIDWNSFSIASGHNVTIDNGLGATLNRVTGSDLSRIDGLFSATGSAYLINQNGIVIGPGGRVVTGGSFIGSTRNISNEEFLNGGADRFSGTSSGDVVNEGSIRAQGGDVVLIGRNVSNRGSIDAPLGTAAMAAGNDVVLQPLGGDRRIYIQGSAGDGNVTNEGAVTAAQAELVSANGNVYALAGNTEGVIRATGSEMKDGRILLSAEGDVSVESKLAATNTDGSGGTVTVRGADIDMSGSVDASAVASGKSGGDVSVIATRTTDFSGKIKAEGGAGAKGGEVETSGAHLHIADSARVSTLAEGGQSGTWLLDPNDFTIAASGGDITGATLSTNLAGGNVAIASNDGATSGNGDIFVNDAVVWSADTTLTLDAVRNIEINAGVDASGANAGLVLAYGGDYSFADGGAVTLSGASASLSMGGNAYTLIYNANDLQAISGSGYYALADNVDASGTASWNSGAGFTPINGFSGVLTGLNHAIDGLTINRTSDAAVGMFAMTSGGFRDFTLSNVSIVSGGSAGALAYRINAGSGISNVHVTGSVTSVGSGGQVGGLIGWNDQTPISGSSSTATVTGFGEVGGLVGRLRVASITNSYATGAVTGTLDYVGGLVGSTYQGGTLTNVYASGNVTGTTNVGGLVGGASFSGAVTATNAYWDADSTGQSTSYAGTSISNANAYTQATYSGFDFTNTWVMLAGETRPMLQSEYATTIFTPHQLQLMALDLGADYTLGANLDMTSAFTANGGGYYGDVWSAAGFDPIGNDDDPSDIKFTGSFDGQDNAISGLTINRPGEEWVGLFGNAENATFSNLVLSGGSVTGGDGTGSLLGELYGGSITSVSTSTTVTGVGFTGGLAGVAQYGTITLSSASGDVTGSGAGIGGLAGVTLGMDISRSYATGDVSGAGLVGGLLGALGYASSDGVLDQSFATGAVTSSDGWAGGLVAHSEGAITNSFATGAVTGTGAASYVAGFIGQNYGSIGSSYSTGLVTGPSQTGGFAGINHGDSSNITSVYWNTETSGQASGIASGDGDITGLTTAEMQGSLLTGFDDAIWEAAAGFYPYLEWLYPDGPIGISGFAYSDAGVTALTGAEIGILSGGSFLGSTGTGANGYYYYLVLPDTLDADGVLAYLDGEATQGAAFSDSVTATGVTGLDILGPSLNLVTGEATLSGTFANLTAMLGLFADTDLDFIDTSATQLTASGQGLYLNAASDYTLDQDLTAGGLLSLTSGGTFTIDADRTLKTTDAGSILVNSGVTWNGAGTLTLNAADNIALNGAIDGQNGGLTLSASGNGSSDIVGTISTSAAGTVDIGTFTLNRGTWEQTDATLPSFSADDFRLASSNFSNASFIRALGGDGSVGDPYQLFDLYGLQGMTVRDARSNDHADYGVNYQLVSDIDASGTVNWNGGAGFDPVNLAGDLDGNGHTIDGLFINRPGNLHAGLIDSWGDRGSFGAPEPIIKDLNLTDADVTGGDRTGILFGFANGSVIPHHLSNISVSGTVTGTNSVGGIAGFMYGQGGRSTATDLQADVTVTATSTYGYAGGLFGQALEGLQISRSRTSGTITGSLAGGLAGEAYDDGVVIQTSYSSATVISTGIDFNYSVGGLVGYGENLTIQQSYFSGQVLGPNGAIVGGIIGDTYADVRLFETYVSGLVQGTGYAGALIGNVGSIYVTVENSVWDIETTGQSDAFGVEPFSPTLTQIGGLTTAEMQGTLDFGLGFSFDNTVWGTGAGLYPYFGWEYATTPIAVTGTAYSDAGTTALAGADVSAISGGSLLGSASTGANGYYYILTAAGSLDASGTLAYLDGEATRAGAFSDALTATGVTGLDIYGSSLNLIAGGSSLGGTLSNLNATLGAYSDTDLNFFNPVSTKVTYDGYGLYLQADQAYTVDGNLTSGSFLSVGGSGTYSVSGDRTLKSTNGGSIVLNSGVTWSGSGTLALEADDNITLNGAVDGQNGRLVLSASGNGSSDDVGTISTGSAGAVDVGRFDLIRGTWEQIGATLPSFSADDFRLATYSEATFIRTRGGDGSVGDPYQLFDLYGLQGITVRDARSTGSADYGVNYLLVDDIDASATRNWNGGAGFAPVLLGGNLDGGGYTIDGLFIDRPGEWAGLISYWSDRATGGAPDVEIRDLRITNADVTGSSAGILFAQQSAEAVAHDLTNIFVSGTVTGTSGVGGVAGSAWGNLDGTGGQSTVSNVHADVTVTATGNAGGLFGNANEEVTILNSSSTGTVNGTFNVGGLVGSSYDGLTIGNSYSTATVNGGTAGGLVGYTSGGLEISDAYSSGAVTATGGSGVAGGIVGYADRNVVIRTSYATGAVSGATAGGLAGTLSSTGNSITGSVWDVETTGQSAAAGVPGSAAITNVDGVTSAEMMQLSTFLGHGFDIDGEGGTGAVWRIYEGYTAPLLRSFMTGLTITGGNGTKNYDGSVTSTDVGMLTYNPSDYDSSLIFGTPVYIAASADEGSYSGSNLTLSGLYSSQLGYDISMNAGAGHLTIAPATPALPSDLLVSSIMPRPFVPAWQLADSEVGPGEGAGGFWSLPLLLEPFSLVYDEESGRWIALDGRPGRINRAVHIAHRPRSTSNNELRSQ